MNVNFLHGRTPLRITKILNCLAKSVPGIIEKIIPSAGRLKFLPGGPARHRLVWLHP